MKDWKKQIDEWDKQILSKYRGKSCIMCGLSKDGLIKLISKAEQQAINKTLQKVEDKINDYSSASSRAENEYQRGISAGIEMFRKYLLNKIVSLREGKE